MKTEDIIYRVNRGYTMSVYGSSQAIHEKMLKDITFLLENNKQLILYGVVNCNCDESKQLEEEFKIKHLINDTYQVVGKESSTVWKQGTMEECNDWVML